MYYVFKITGNVLGVKEHWKCSNCLRTLEMFNVFKKAGNVQGV